MDKSYCSFQTRVEPGYNDIALCDTPSKTSDILYSVAPINSSLLTITLYSRLEQHSLVTTQDLPMLDVITEFDCMYKLFCKIV